jgi:hypothetical protein
MLLLEEARPKVKKVIRRLSMKARVMTRGDKGMAWKKKDVSRKLKAETKNVRQE